MEESDSFKPEQDSASDLEISLGYHFVRPELLEQALTHRSYAVEHRIDALDNERFEFLGDAVLELVVSHLLFTRYGERCREGELTRMRSFLVNESQLATQARRLKLGKHLRLGKGEDRSGGREKQSILSDTFEAVIGAIYLDSGIEKVFSFIKSCFGDLLDQAMDTGLGQDYKSKLQELTQGRFHSVPVYEIEKVSGPDHQRIFDVAIHFNGQVLQRGSGRSKKEAEQDAARKALCILDT
ncbi:MAG: ribonuclease III [Deltaproteobacteria bacterium]|nr:ribonuclease III [Deltaproteobacteria bacterium]MDL1961091.1 ribonuclease III [Deltaproteobacteria bacterium]